MKFPLGEKGEIAPILVPRFIAEINDAALAIELEESDDPLIDLDGIDMTVRLQDSEQGMLLSVDSFDIYKKRALTPEHCDQLLALISPSLEDAAEMSGEFSLSLAKLSIPVGVSEQQMLDRLEAQGELALHE